MNKDFINTANELELLQITKGKGADSLNKKIMDINWLMCINCIEHIKIFFLSGNFYLKKQYLFVNCNYANLC